MWNKRTVCYGALSALLLAAGCAGNRDEVVSIKPQSEPVTEEAPAPVLPEHYTSAPAAEKEETVNAKADPDGTVTKIQVETNLHGAQDDAYIEDSSILTDIRNTDGAEEFFPLEENNLVWENCGQTIHYKGTSTQPLPVGVAVSYYLDGNRTEPSELAGKSGHVRIRFDYHSDAVSAQTIDGVSYQMKMPFTAVTMIPLSDHFSNVTAVNGEVIRFGDTEAVVGVALPGIQDALRLSDNELTEEAELPEYVELEADVDQFELDFTATVFTPGLFSNLDEDTLNDLSEATGDVNELSDASGKLKDGTKELYDGMTEFKTYFNEYNSGVAKVGEGIGALRDGLAVLDDNSDALTDGACTLSEGLRQFSDGLAAVDLSKLTPDTSSKEQQEMMAKVMAAQEDLPKQVAAINTTVTTLSQLVVQMTSFQADAEKTCGDLQGVIDSLKQGYTVLNEDQMKELLAAFEPETENYNTVKAALDYYNALPEKLKAITIPEIPAYDAKALSTAAASFNTAVTAFSQDLGVLSAYLESISKTMEGMKDLPAMVTKLQTAAKQLADGSSQLKEGIKAYTDGVGAVHDGVSQLAEGMGALPEASGALSEGYNQILEGTWSLADGMKEFDEQGIQEIAKLGSGQMKDMIRRAKALRLADGEYVNYAGITDGTKGSVRFLIETGKIENN
ncbi:MAG: hypothetical protein IIZ10_01745 [Solobacterium sp.]|nr:hypothetical protein [Solobacterium sp.]